MASETFRRMNHFSAIEVEDFSTAAPDDYSAIVMLEERTIPWQNGAHGPPSRPLRNRPKTYPLFAAEGDLRRSTRAGTPGIGGESGPASTTEFERQNQQFLRWAKRRHRLIDRRLECRLENIGGVEHEVFFDAATNRWIKITMPGRSGKEIQANEDVVGVRPTLMTGDALPSSYLRRLMLANRRLGDDFWLHGVVPHPAGPRIVISQRHLRGRPARTDEIVDHFVVSGFREINAKTFYHSEERLLVSDAHTANVFVTEKGIAPFDVCVQRPRGTLLNAVRPSPKLSFDNWDEEQPKLF